MKWAKILGLSPHTQASSEEVALMKEEPTACDEEEASVQNMASASNSKPSDSIPRVKKVLYACVLVTWRCLLGFLILWGLIDSCRRAAHLINIESLETIDDPWTFCRKICGNTEREALSKGCVFDELENRFTKPECINKEVSDEFSNSGNGPDGRWLYKTEVDGEMVFLNVTEIIPLIHPGRVVWLATSWHLMHCMYVWRKISLSRFDGTIIPMARDEQDTHGKHCVRLLSDYLIRDPSDEDYVAKAVYGS